MELWIATSNKGKLSEFKLLFDKELPALRVFSQADLPTFHAPPENGKTFLDNARIKARSMKAMKPGQWVMGEDSGLEVEALNNLPGIHSARYAGPHASDSENMAKLLKMLQIRTNAVRKARFLCTMVVFPRRRRIAVCRRACRIHRKNAARANGIWLRSDLFARRRKQNPS